jgi:asparagine synthase (glutamine-hydrolysing)
MSAICGIVHFDGRPVDPADLRQMAASSPHRGPDGVSYLVEDSAGFAFLAFHVTPESVAEAQPWKDPETGVVLVADARIDNRGELDLLLKDELSRLKPLPQGGDRPQAPAGTIPDSLYILAAWRKWGTSCAEHLLGDFVFAVWDRKERSLFLARDPLGSHCLHYCQDGERFIFTSDLCAILDLPGVTITIDEERVLREIEFLPRSHQETFFTGMFYLPPAHCMTVAPGLVRTWRYWDIDEEPRIRYESDGDYAEQLLELIDQAVLSRLRCAGPVGLSLSGGYDSTLLAASIARLLPAAGPPPSRLQSYSYVFNELQECDEAEWIDSVVEMYDLDARYIDGDQLWTFRNLEEWSVPRDYLWTNCFVNLPRAVAGSASQSGCRLLIDGQVGDALFGGPNYTIADLIHRRQYAELWPYLKRNLKRMDLRSDILRHGVAPSLPQALQSLYRQLRQAGRGCLIGGYTPDKQKLVKRLKSEPPAIDAPAFLPPGSAGRYRSVLNPAWSQGLAAARGPGYNRYRLEQSWPYYDLRIVEFLLSTPEDRICRPGSRRFLQKTAMRKRLPESVCERDRKTTFTPLLAKGLLKKERSRVRDLVQDPLIVRQGWVRADWLKEQVEAGSHWAGGGYPLSNCLHLELWLRAVVAGP